MREGGSSSWLARGKWHGESPWDKETDELLRRRQNQSALDESTETGSWASGKSKTVGHFPAW